MGSGLLVNDVDGGAVEHEKSNFSFFDTGKEDHVDKHTVFTDDVLFAEIHEVGKRVEFNMVILGFSALDLGIKRDDTILDAVGVDQLYTPDTFTSGTTVLLQDTFAESKSLGEGGLELIDIVVGISIGGDKGSIPQFAQSIFGTISQHSIGVGHTANTVGAEFSEHVEIFAFLLEVSGVDTADIGISSLQDMFINLIALIDREENYFSCPSTFDEGINHGQGVTAVSIRTLVRATTNFEENDVLLKLRGH